MARTAMFKKSNSIVVSKEKFLNSISLCLAMERKKYKELFEDFVEGIKNASKKIKEIGPDYLIVSLNGGLPLYDSLTIIDRDFDDPSMVVYMPTSSKFKDSVPLTRRCFENLLSEKLDESDKSRKFVSLDEILSGGSVARLLNSYHFASRQIAKKNLQKYGKQPVQKIIDEEAEKIRERMSYQIVGLREQRPELKMKNEYIKNVKEGLISEIPVSKIITLDNKDVQIIEWLKPRDAQFYLPKIVNFQIKISYLNFLESIATYVGVDPENVGPKNLEKIKNDCEKYSKKSRKL